MTYLVKHVMILFLNDHHVITTHILIMVHEHNDQTTTFIQAHLKDDCTVKIAVLTYEHIESSDLSVQLDNT